MILMPKVIISEGGNLPTLGFKESVIRREQSKYGGARGALYLTNKRLIFEHEAGIITKRIYVSLDIPLQEITALNIEGRFKPKLVVLAKDRVGRIEIEVQNPTKWVNKIWEALHKLQQK